MTLYAPNGLPITGTLEHLFANALIEQETARLDDDGRTVFEYQGFTDCFWNTQDPVLRPKQWDVAGRLPERIYLDEENNEWFASDLTDIPPRRGDDQPALSSS